MQRHERYLWERISSTVSVLRLKIFARKLSRNCSEIECAGFLAHFQEVAKGHAVSRETQEKNP